MQTISERLSGWSEEDLGNLGAVLEIKSSHPSVEDICEGIKWLYHSKLRAGLRAGYKNQEERFKAVLEKRPRRLYQSDEQYSMPDYDELVDGLASLLRVNDPEVGLEQQEEYISHDIIIQALSKMSPKERTAFFSAQVEAASLVNEAGVGGGKMQGPVTTLVALGTAQAAGMSLYIAATTALGFLTHAVGITLPFAVYTGLSSTIAFVIGPAGWLAAGGWAFMKATGPEWKLLAPGLIYIIAVNSRRSLVANRTMSEVKSS